MSQNVAQFRQSQAKPLSKTEQVRAAVGRRNLPFSISELQRDCPGVSKEMIRKVLSELRGEGLVRLEGHGRGARWHPREG